MRTQNELQSLLDSNSIELLEFDAGQGGSAHVHKARALATNDELGLEIGDVLAIKEYKDDLLASEGQRERIAQEFAVGRSIQHESIVRIRGLISDAVSSPLLIMDWVAGVSLEHWCMQPDGAHTWEQARRITLGLVGGLEVLHERGVKHRDVKPANVFVMSNGHPVLMDMGVIEVATNDESTLHTSLKDFIGSVRYAAPQFVRGEAFDFSDDVYSLGATLHLLCTRKRVFESIERKSLLPHCILTERQKVGELLPGFPPQLKVLIEGALHPNRTRRPSLEDLREFFHEPESAKYVQRELDERSREERGFRVISVQDNGATVFADMRSVEPSAHSFVVVRELNRIKVPSLGADARAEKWIADVQLKHVHNGLGQFAVQEKRWRPGTPGNLFKTTYESMGSPGTWLNHDKHTDTPRIGDLVVSHE